MSKLLDVSAANFLQIAISNGFSARDVVADPDTIAAKLGSSLCDDERSGIQRLNDPDIQKRFTSLSDDARKYMGEVVKDGRYLADWKNRPAEVGQRLGLTVEPSIVTEIEHVDLSDVIVSHGNPTTMRAATVISVAVAVIVAASGHGDEEMPVIDFSKMEKL